MIPKSSKERYKNVVEGFFKKYEAEYFREIKDEDAETKAKDIMKKRLEEQKSGETPLVNAIDDEEKGPTVKKCVVCDDAK
jgi:hypothetical protein